MSQPLTKEKNLAIKMRLKGMSYSQIKSKLKVSKGSLSLWLASYPLSPERIKELRGDPKKIENYRQTMALKREAKFNIALSKARANLGSISNRDLLILGFALYWAEGAKTKTGSLILANTDPNMLKIYLKWLRLLGVPKKDLKFKLHIYKDMKEGAIISFWTRKLGVKSDQFRKTYIKNSRIVDLTYKNGFGHGTCNIIYEKAEFARYVFMGIKHIIESLHA